MNLELLTKAKSLGFSDRQIAHLTGTTEDAVRAERKKVGLLITTQHMIVGTTRSKATRPRR
jgi:hypothetical protein